MSSKENEFKISISFRLTFSKSADGPGFLKRDTTRLKQGLALRLLSKGLFYVRAVGVKDYSI